MCNPPEGAGGGPTLRHSLNKFSDEDRSMPINDLSRPEWHRRASENLHRFLLQLEAQLTSATITSQTAATKLLVVEVKRRLNEFDRLIAEEAGTRARH